MSIWCLLFKYKPWHIPLKYRCSVKKSDHIRRPTHHVAAEFSFIWLTDVSNLLSRLLQRTNNRNYMYSTSEVSNGELLATHLQINSDGSYGSRYFDCHHMSYTHACKVSIEKVVPTNLWYDIERIFRLYGCCMDAWTAHDESYGNNIRTKTYDILIKSHFTF